MYTVTVRMEFNAAHRLRDYRGKCEDLHGHNWTVEATLAAEKLNNTGMVVDFTEVKKELAGLLEKLDHKFLNDLEPFKEVNPTSENIARWLYQGLQRKFSGDKIKLVRVTIWETATSQASYEE